MHEHDRETIQEIEAYYAQHGRHDLPWRNIDQAGSIDPYRVLVSELMLQQTQVSRALPKYHEFLALFPTVQDLASAPLSAVLMAWQGLGYNRRAKYLWLAAKEIQSRWSGAWPLSSTELRSLPGVGPSTAGAVLAYAYNEPAVFLETNVRTVLIHHYYSDAVEPVSDGELLEIAGRLSGMTELSPREWNWALMDYGTYLKRTRGNLNKLSKGYQKQSKFHGSRRELRGRVLRELSTGPQKLNKLRIVCADDRFDSVLQDLLSEVLVSIRNDIISLSDGAAHV